jgi:Tfp pilus assembly protein PilN
MSVFLENKKLLVHMAVEIVVIAGVTVYFYKKNKNLQNRLTLLENKISTMSYDLSKIDKLQKKLEKQEELINKLLSEKKQPESIPVQEVVVPVQQVVPVQLVVEESVNTQEVEHVQLETVEEPELTLSGEVLENASQFVGKINIDEGEEGEEDEDDIPNLEENLDNEIKDELNELNDV